MKTRLLFIAVGSVILSIFLSLNNADAIPPMESEYIYEISDSIVVGKVIFVNSTFSPNNILYHIEVEKFLKNLQDTDVIFAAGPNTENSRIGNLIFDVGDRALFFLQNNTLGYDQYSEIFRVHYESGLVKPEWDSCDIFKTSIPKEHWVLGGIGPRLKVQQENSTNDNDFVIGKEILITYDIFNHTPEEQTIPFGMTITNRDDPDSLYIFTETTSHLLEPCVPYRTLTWSFTPSQYGNYAAKFDNLMGSRHTAGFTIEEPTDSNAVEYNTHFSTDSTLQRTNGGSVSSDKTVYPVPWARGPPLKQFNDGFSIYEIYCKNDLVLILKYNGSPACVKHVTKQHLIDRGWAKTAELNEIKNNPDSLKLNIVRIEDGRVSLHPENTCASIHLDLLSETDIQRYRNDKKGLDSTNVLHITSDDLKEIPNIEELIYAVHSIDAPYNKHSSVLLDGMSFVEYELFLMGKAIKKYDNSQEDYFIKLDEDYEERFTNPAKQGFSNTFEAPIIVYNDKAYSVDGTVFWTSDEHEPMRMGVYPKDVIDEDEKFIILTDDDMKSVPKIKEAIEGIGTIKESVTGFKGLAEDEWNQYMEWFAQKSQAQLGSDSFRLIEFNDELYSIGFAIC